ncbi:hypothetical protein [Frigoriglobus tundricola]|uniref:Uncharacterized protein n=1 Tax=Frigoriglobus tundricola TaxID=2774151 RepID=A0A6M5YGF8_9BACT|nr:hypothetical protein [Frigoriglobus tundricola]QJW93095.1 hypothetical protein FTUN_0598 [Frigoriglobus tundricola]
MTHIHDDLKPGSTKIVPPSISGPRTTVTLLLSVPEAATLYAELMLLGAVTRPARGTAAHLTPVVICERVEMIDRLRRKLAVALHDGGC